LGFFFRRKKAPEEAGYVCRRCGNAATLEGFFFVVMPSYLTSRLLSTYVTPKDSWMEYAVTLFVLAVLSILGAMFLVRLKPLESPDKTPLE